MSVNTLHIRCYNENYFTYFPSGYTFQFIRWLNKILQMSQFLLPQIKIPLSSSQSGLSFERTSLSPKVLGLRNATRGGFGKMAFNVGEFSKIQ